MQRIVVSLTSYPARINTVIKAIQSLWVQTVLADEIVLYLSLIEFPGKEEDLPVELFEMIGKNGFRVEWVNDNLKSHKKYFYALQNYSNDIVITVDDDVNYAESMISDLMSSYRMFPESVSARRVRIIVREDKRLTQYKNWDWFPQEYAGQSRMDLCAVGIGGVLYPPAVADARWFDVEKIKTTSENQDDIWLKFNELVDHIPVAYVKPTQTDILLLEEEAPALYTRNVCDGENDLCIEKLLLWFQANDLQQYESWFAGLMRMDDYISGRKKYYYKMIKAFVDEPARQPVYLYGAGKKAVLILKLLTDIQLINQIEAILVADRLRNPEILEGIKVRQIDEIDKNSLFKVIIGVGRILQKEVNEILHDYSCKCLELDVRGIIRLQYEE